MSNETRKLKELKASFPNAETATDEEILAFGVKFVLDYNARIKQELDDFRTAVELTRDLAGSTDTPKNQKLGIALRQSLTETLDRLANVMKGKLDATSNPPGIIGPTQN